MILHTGERFDRDLAFLRDIMNDFGDEAVRSISCMCSAQSCKTATMQALMGWTLAEDPGPALWVTVSTPDAKKLVKARLWPMYERTKVIADKLPREKGKKNLLELYFQNGSYLYVAGAENEAALQSTPFRYLFLDEIRQWKAGRVAMVQNRTRRFPHNYKHVMISCPDMEGDDVHRHYRDGSQCRWLIPCRNPACGHEFELTWGEKGRPGGIKWDTDETTKPEGKWNYDAAIKTLRFECEACGERYTAIEPGQADRKYFCRAGRWQSFNPNAPSCDKSYHWNAMLPHFVDWKVELKKFLQAVGAIHWGDFKPLQDHWNETRGLPWTDRLRHAKEERFLDQRQRDYDPTAPWSLEKRRFITVDVQGKGGRHFWVLIRAHGLGAVSRMLHFSKEFSWEALEALRVEWKVAPEDVVVDAAWQSAEVYRKIVESGYKWKAFHGQDKPCFLVNGRKMIWQLSSADPALGTQLAGRVRPIKLFHFSKPATLERLYLQMYGEMGDWQILADASEEYRLQVTAWDRRYRVGRNGEEIAEWYAKRTDDHGCDCERMQIAAASISGLLMNPQELAPGEALQPDMALV